MKPHPNRPPAGLRRAAEARRKAQPATRPPQTRADLQRLQHELEVHQIELEMQNEELRTAQAEITSGLQRYIDLFDFAPVGYFNLTADGTIRLVNLTGARMLNSERARLLRRRFGSFVAEPDRRAFGDCLARLFATGTKQTLEIALEPAGGPPLAGLLEVTRAPDDRQCRVVLVDVSERMRVLGALERGRDLRTESERIGKVGGWEFNLDTQKQIWTEEIYRIHEVELTFEPTVAKSLAFYTPAGRPIIERALQRAIEAGEPFDLELEIITAKANLRFVRTIGRADRDHRRVYGFFQDITAHKLAEDALHQSEDRYRLLVEESPDGIGIYQDGKLVFVNSAGARQAGAKSKNEILGRSIEQIVHPDDRPAALDRLRRRLAGETGVYPAEVRYLRLDGVVVPMEVGATLIFYRGKPAMQLMVRDISERKRAETALRESEERHRTIIRTAIDGFWLVNLRGQLLDVNAAYCQMSGYGRAELLAMSIADLEAAETPTETAAHMQRVVAQGHDRFESRHRRKDRSIYPVEISVQYNKPTKDECMVVFLRDITERKRAEAALGESEDRLRLSVRSANVGLWDWNLGTDEVYFSPEWKGQLGYADDEIAGRYKDWISRLHPEDAEPAVRKFKAFIANPVGRYQSEYRLRHKDGSYRWITSLGDVSRDAAGKVVRMLGCHVDITESKQTEEALRTSERFSHSVLNSLTAHIAVLDEHGTIVAVNEAWQRFAREHGGHHPAAYVGANYLAVSQEFLQRGQEELLEETFRGLLAVMGGGQAEFALEYPRHFPDGHRWFHLRATRFPGEGPVRVVVAHEDITERKLSADALNESEHRFLQLAENINEVFWLRDAATQALLYISPGYEQIWRQTCASLFAGQPAWLETIHPEDRERISRTADQLTERVQDEEFRIVWPDRSIRWIRNRSFPIRNAAGKVFRIAGVAEDITAQHEVEIMTRERLAIEAQLSKLVATVPGAIYTFRLNPDGSASLPYTSARFAGMFGVDPAVVVRDAGAAFRRVHPEDRALFESSVQASAQSLSPWSCVARVGDPKTGYRWIEGRSLPERAPDGSILWHGFLLDITERKNSEARLRALTEQLRQLAARLNRTREEERASLAREMHDVVAQELIRLKMDLSKMQRHLAGAGNLFGRQPLLKDLAAAISLTDQSLSSVQQIATELRPAALDSLGLCASIQGQANEFTNRTHIPCHVSVPTENLYLHHDVSTALFRIVQEALTNVDRHARASRVDIRLGCEGEQLLLTIQDDGCGMAPGKFTDATSIGLLGMHERTLLLGAQLAIVSQPGQGTTIKVTLHLTLDSP